MNFIIFILVVVVLTVIPVMIAAKLLGAKNTSFWSCVFAVIASVAAENIAEQVVSNPGFSGLIAVAVTAVCFSLILGAKYIQSVLIALLSIGVQYGIALLVAGMGIATGVASVSA
jgi:hypothetical protein